MIEVGPFARPPGVCSALITPIAIAVFAIWPPPYDEGAAKWFELLQENKILGLVSLDLLFVVVNVLMIPVMLGLYMALRRVSPPTSRWRS